MQVSDGTRSETSHPATLKAVGAPVIYRQPASAEVLLNSMHVLSVGVDAASGTVYQWLKNGQPIPGASGRNLVPTNVAFATAGQYSVVVGNLFGRVTNEPAVLTVRELTGSVVAKFTPANMTFTDATGVYGIKVLPDGSVLVGGQIATVAGVNHPLFAKLTVTGTPAGGGWSANPPGGASGLRVVAFELLPDGRVLMAGQFTAVQGFNVANLARLNPDGSLDSGVPDPDLNNEVRAILPVGDDVLVVGQFTRVINATTYGTMIRVSGASGQIDPQFGPLSSQGGGMAAALFPDGRAVVGGNFTAPKARLLRAFAQYTGDEGIAAHPASTLVTPGSPLSLSVGWYGGSTAAYQWYKNGQPIAGATGQSYTVNAVTAADTGSYHVTVTTTRGILTSQTAIVTVTGASAT